MNNKKIRVGNHVQNHYDSPKTANKSQKNHYSNITSVFQKKLPMIQKKVFFFSPSKLLHSSFTATPILGKHNLCDCVQLLYTSHICYASVSSLKPTTIPIHIQQTSDLDIFYLPNGTLPVSLPLKSCVPCDDVQTVFCDERV